MRIEVSEQTFYRVFSDESYKTTKNEQCEVFHYENEELQQSGLKVWNYASSKVHQYYLNDINA